MAMRRHSDQFGQEREAPLQLALIGAGAMGRNHARVIAQSTRVQLAVVVDPDRDRAAAAAAFADAAVSDTAEAALACDAAVIAAPTPFHEAVAVALLAAGVPVLVEKPITADLASTERVVKASVEHDVPLMCGFVERFNPAVATALRPSRRRPAHLTGGLRHSPPATPSASSDVCRPAHPRHRPGRPLGRRRRPRQRGGHDLDSAAPAKAREIADCTICFDRRMVATLSASRMRPAQGARADHPTPDRLDRDRPAPPGRHRLPPRPPRAGRRPLHHLPGRDGRSTSPSSATPASRWPSSSSTSSTSSEGRADADDERTWLLGPHAIAAAVVDGSNRAGSSAAAASAGPHGRA